MLTPSSMLIRICIICTILYHTFVIRVVHTLVFHCSFDGFDSRFWLLSLDSVFCVRVPRLFFVTAGAGSSVI